MSVDGLTHYDMIVTPPLPLQYTVALTHSTQMKPSSSFEATIFLQPNHLFFCGPIQPCSSEVEGSILPWPWGPFCVDFALSPCFCKFSQGSVASSHCPKTSMSGQFGIVNYLSVCVCVSVHDITALTPWWLGLTPVAVLEEALYWNESINTKKINKWYSTREIIW